MHERRFFIKFQDGSEVQGKGLHPSDVLRTKRPDYKWGFCIKSHRHLTFIQSQFFSSSVWVYSGPHGWAEAFTLLD